MSEELSFLEFLFQEEALVSEQPPAPEEVPAPGAPSGPKKRGKETSSGEVKCPACSKVLVSRKALPKHLSACREWSSFSPGVPPSSFNFDRHYAVGVWAPDQVPGVDYVTCLLCEAQGTPFRKKKIQDHLRGDHGMQPAEYQARFPGALMSCSGTLAVRTKTVMERHGVANVFQLEEVKAQGRETMLDKYGADNPMKVEEIRAKAAETNLERYGAANPFASEEVKVKIRETMIDRYGAANPQQVESLREKTLQTNLARYGDRFYFRTPEFRAKFERVMKRRYGVTHPMYYEPFRLKLRATNLDKYGVENPLSTPEVKARVRATNLKNHGGVHSQQCPHILDKARATWMRKRGVDNPSKDPAVLLKILQTWERKYGSCLPPAWLKNYGLEPNNFEKRVALLYPDYEYAGNGRARVKMASGKWRVPDFIKRHPETGVITHVVEAFGDFWHGPSLTGETNEEHEARCIREYAQVGVQCVVVWERDVPA